MATISVSVSSEVGEKIRQVAESSHSAPEVLAARLLERALADARILDEALAVQEPKSAVPFDEKRWEEMMAKIHELGKRLPQYPDRVFTTEDFYPGEE